MIEAPGFYNSTLSFEFFAPSFPTRASLPAIGVDIMVDIFDIFYRAPPVFSTDENDNFIHSFGVHFGVPGGHLSASKFPRATDENYITLLAHYACLIPLQLSLRGGYRPNWRLFGQKEVPCYIP